MSTALLTPTVEKLVRQLYERGPWTLDSWVCFADFVQREEFVDLCQSLAGMGLIAFGLDRDNLPRNYRNYLIAGCVREKYLR